MKNIYWAKWYYKHRFEPAFREKRKLEQRKLRAKRPEKQIEYNENRREVYKLKGGETMTKQTRKPVTEADFNIIKALFDAGISGNKIGQTTDRGAGTVWAVKNSKDYEAYKALIKARSLKLNSKKKETPSITEPIVASEATVSESELPEVQHTPAKLKTYDRKASVRFIDELVARFINGERLTVEDIVNEYFPHTTPLQYMLSKAKAKGLLKTTVKQRFTKQGLPFGCVDELNHFGVINTDAEARYQVTRLYILAKGINANAQKVVQYARGENLLPNGTKMETIALPKVK